MYKYRKELQYSQIKPYIFSYIILIVSILTIYIHAYFLQLEQPELPPAVFIPFYRFLFLPVAR